MLRPSSVQPLKSNNSNIFQLVNDVKSGKVDAKQRTLEILNKMSPEQKQAVTQVLPTFLKLGKAFGVSEKNITAFNNELSEILQGRNKQ